MSLNRIKAELEEVQLNIEYLQKELVINPSMGKSITAKLSAQLKRQIGLTKKYKVYGATGHTWVVEIIGLSQTTTNYVYYPGEVDEESIPELLSRDLKPHLDNYIYKITRRDYGKKY